MSDYLAKYGAGDEEKERRTKRIVLGLFVAVVAAPFYTRSSTRGQRSAPRTVSSMRFAVTTINRRTTCGAAPNRTRAAITQWTGSCATGSSGHLRRPVEAVLRRYRFVWRRSGLNAPISGRGSRRVVRGQIHESPQLRFHGPDALAATGTSRRRGTTLPARASLPRPPLPRVNGSPGNGTSCRGKPSSSASRSSGRCVDLPNSRCDSPAGVAARLRGTARNCPADRSWCDTQGSPPFSERLLWSPCPTAPARDGTPRTPAEIASGAARG